MSSVSRPITASERTESQGDQLKMTELANTWNIRIQANISGWSKFPDVNDQSEHSSQTRLESANGDLFPERNMSDVAARLSKARILLAGFLDQLEVERLRMLDRVKVKPWHLDLSRSRTILRASDKGFFKV